MTGMSSSEAVNGVGADAVMPGALAAKHHAEETEVLRGWERESVQLTGTVDKRGSLLHQETVLLRDLEVTLPNRERHQIAHSWVQKADTLKKCEPGSRVSFRATVRSYLDRKTGRRKWGFHFPSSPLVVQEPPPALCQTREVGPVPVSVPPMPRKGQTPRPTVLEALETARRLLDEVGIEAVRTVFALGLEKTGEIFNMADALGGVQDAEKVLGMMRAGGPHNDLRQESRP
jgi:hypothetical protein